MPPKPLASIDWLLVRPFFFAVFFVGMWTLVSLVIGFAGGWAALSKRFRCKGKFHGATLPFRSAQMGFFAHYGSCLSFGANESGLYLSVFPIFRIGHPPLFIPWSEISVVAGEKGLIFKKQELRLGRQELIALRISTSLAETLRRSAGPAWPVESIAA